MKTIVVLLSLFAIPSSNAESRLEQYVSALKSNTHSVEVKKQALLGVKNHFKRNFRVSQEEIDLAVEAIEGGLNSEREVFETALGIISELGGITIDAAIRFISQKPCDEDQTRLEYCEEVLSAIRGRSANTHNHAANRFLKMMENVYARDSFTTIHLVRLAAELCCLHWTGFEIKECKKQVRPVLEKTVGYYESDGATDPLALWIVNDGSVLIEEIDELGFWIGNHPGRFTYHRLAEASSSLEDAYKEVSRSVSEK